MAINQTLKLILNALNLAVNVILLIAMEIAILTNTGIVTVSVALTLNKNLTITTGLAFSLRLSQITHNK